METSGVYPFHLVWETNKSTHTTASPTIFILREIALPFSSMVDATNGEKVYKIEICCAKAHLTKDTGLAFLIIFD